MKKKSAYTYFTEGRPFKIPFKEGVGWFKKQIPQTHQKREKSSMELKFLQLSSITVKKNVS